MSPESCYQKLLLLFLLCSLSYEQVVTEAALIDFHETGTAQVCYKFHAMTQGIELSTSMVAEKAESRR